MVPGVVSGQPGSPRPFPEQGGESPARLMVSCLGAVDGVLPGSGAPLTGSGGVGLQGRVGAVLRGVHSLCLPLLVLCDLPKPALTHTGVMLHPLD